MTTTSAPIADVSSKTVTSGGKTFVMRPLAEDSYTVLINGVPVGRVVYSFGAANAVVEGTDVTEDELTAIGEAWFEALEGAQA